MDIFHVFCGKIALFLALCDFARLEIVMQIALGATFIKVHKKRKKIGIFKTSVKMKKGFFDAKSRAFSENTCL